ncbi:hypothetical protein BHE74_00002290 [Ensete ventricosum]|nr:hypothetical protein BHE74_00002290 [Ensete ventricosum]
MEQWGYHLRAIDSTATISAKNGAPPPWSSLPLACHAFCRRGIRGAKRWSLELLSKRLFVRNTCGGVRKYEAQSIKINCGLHQVKLLKQSSENEDKRKKTTELRGRRTIGPKQRKLKPPGLEVRDRRRYTRAAQLEERAYGTKHITLPIRRTDVLRHSRLLFKSLMPSSSMRSESSCSITTPREESETMASWMWAITATVTAEKSSDLEQGFKDRCHGIEYKCATGFDWSSFVT